MKLIDKTLILKSELQSYIQNELTFLISQKNSQYILQIYEYFQDENALYIIMEYFQSSNLFNYVIKNKPNQDLCIILFMQMLFALV